MTKTATAEQIDRGIIAAITGEPPANERWREMSQIELRAQGFVIGIGDQDDKTYHADPCQFPSLNQTIAFQLVNECADYAQRQHPRLGGVRVEPTEAMLAGSLFDKLLTESIDFQQQDAPAVWSRLNKSTKKTDTVCYSDWNGLRVIDADSFSSACARECRDDATAKGLQPILQSELEEAVEQAKELRIRLELAGLDLKAGKQQVPIYWVEFADDGTPVQCRAKLDQVEGWTIRDLKKTESLRLKSLARKVWDYGLDIQAAAYLSAMERITGEYGRYKFEWAFVKIGRLVSARRVPIGSSMLEMGRTRWRFAVNQWAKCMREGFWPGYELDVQRLEAEPWMESQVAEMVAENGEYDDGE